MTKDFNDMADEIIKEMQNFTYDKYGTKYKKILKCFIDYITMIRLPDPINYKDREEILSNDINKYKTERKALGVPLITSLFIELKKYLDEYQKLMKVNIASTY